MHISKHIVIKIIIYEIPNYICNIIKSGLTEYKLSVAIQLREVIIWLMISKLDFY